MSSRSQFVSSVIVLLVAW